MTASDWEHIQDLFAEALERPADERAAFLDAACAEAPALRAEVESLLQAADAEGPFDALANDLGALSTHVHADPDANRRIGPYQLVERIGEGGMGTVYRATRADGQFEQQVALKLIHRHAGTPERQRRFLTERQILARLHHPHIAQLHDGGVTNDGAPYFAMEYVEGQPIDAYCDTGRLPIEDRLALFMQVCEAVQYAHRNLVVHRDLKPGNILVTQQGRVKLLDFGIAKLMDDDADAATQTTMPMTPAYASPEQMGGGTITTASDVYQLGVVLYELLTGQRPYDVRHLSPSEAERVIREREPARPSTAITRTDPTSTDITRTPEAISAARSTHPAALQRHLAGDLDVMVLRALHKEPERRYASAEAFLDDIKRYLAGLPVTARPDTFSYRAAKFIRRHRLGVTAAGLVVMALLVGLGGTLWQAQKAAQERDEAERAMTRSDHMATFLLSLFESADPLRAHADSITAREILDAGATRIEQELADQPDVQAALWDAIALVNQNLARYDEALTLTERAYETRVALYGAEHPDVATSLMRLAEWHIQQGNYDTADSLLRPALALQRRLLGNDHPDVATTLDNLGDVVLETGSIEDAEPLYRDALAIRRDALGDSAPEVATSLNSVATVLYMQNKLNDAEPLFREALAIRQQALGPEHLDVASSFNNLAIVLDALGKQDEAEPFYRRALAMRQERLGDMHPFVATNLNNLAYLLYAQGKYDEAEPLYRQALAINRKAFGNEHPDVAIRLNNLARLLQEKGQYDEAIAMHREALAIRRAVFDDPHPHIAHTLHNLAGVYHELQYWNQALPLYREALAIRQQVLPATHPLIASTQSSLGDCLRRTGQLEEAETLLLGALAIVEAAPEGQERLLGNTRARLADLYEAWEQPDKAETYRE